MHYRLRPLRPGQFALFSLFVLMTVAAIVFGIFRLPIPLFGKIASLSALCTGFLFWKVCNPNRVNRGRLATIDPLGTLLILSIFLLAIGTGHRGAFQFSSFDVLVCVSLLFLMTGHLLPRAMRAFNDHWRIDR
jgi:hypothetical protein